MFLYKLNYCDNINQIVFVNDLRTLNKSFKGYSSYSEGARWPSGRAATPHARTAAGTRARTYLGQGGLRSYPGCRNSSRRRHTIALSQDQGCTDKRRGGPGRFTATDPRPAAPTPGAGARRTLHPSAARQSLSSSGARNTVGHLFKF